MLYIRCAQFTASDLMEATCCPNVIMDYHQLEQMIHSVDQVFQMSVRLSHALHVIGKVPTSSSGNANRRRRVRRKAAVSLCAIFCDADKIFAPLYGFHSQFLKRSIHPHC